MANRGVVGLVVILGFPAMVHTAEPETWKVHQAESGEFAVSYPPTLQMSRADGEICRGDICKPIEGFTLHAPPKFRQRNKAIQFDVLRGVNPEKLPIAKWYEARYRRPIDPAAEKLVTVGGKPAIHMAAEMPVLSAKGNLSGEPIKLGKDGKQVKKPRERIQVRLNPTDVLAIYNQAPQTEFDEIFQQVVATIRIR